MTKTVYQEVKSKKDFGFWNQITRAAVSVMNNISEGFESNSDKDFIRYLGYAKASCGEVRNMCYIALDIEYIDLETHHLLVDHCRQTAGAIYGMIQYLKRCDGEGGERSKGRRVEKS